MDVSKIRIGDTVYVKAIVEKIKGDIALAEKHTTYFAAGQLQVTL